MSNQKSNLHSGIKIILIPSIPKELIGIQCQYMCTINFIVISPRPNLYYIWIYPEQKMFIYNLIEKSMIIYSIYWSLMITEIECYK